MTSSLMDDILDIRRGGSREMSFLSAVAADHTCQYPQKCGNLTINYPFEIEGTNCGHRNFSILCKDNITFGDGAIPFLKTPTGEYQIMNISTDHLIINTTHLKAISCNVSQSTEVLFSLPVDPPGPFTISGTNVFASVGCYANGSFYSNETTKAEGIIVGGSCAASCVKITEPEYCNGFGCCQTSILENWKKVDFSAKPYTQSDQCVFSTVLDPTTFVISPPERGKWGAGNYGLKLDWAIGEDGCSSAKQNGPLACSENADCFKASGMPGYVCNCTKGYEGDGYVGGLGCTDIDECSHPELNDCLPPPLGICVNTEGSYNCSCPEGSQISYIDGRKYCIKYTKTNRVVPALIGVFSTLVAGPLIALGILWLLKKRKQKLLRRKYFHQNGGRLLQEYISSDRGRKKVNIFSEAELEKATDNFSDDLKVGAGGFGFVYQGNLAEGRLVAIKRCKEVDQEQIDQFINEVIILSQIDHRNVIKLLGCCLETQIPLLVYEYVSNGTLYDHLNGKDGKSLTWENRLQITIQTAEALAYLHSAASVPIVHRDVKSSNILLDYACIPKLSDFGLSRLMPMDDSHLTTGVKGTLGYLDPQYFMTVQLTDKTDVYSFGVVMVEMLTGMKPVSLERAKEDRNLASLFLLRKKKGPITEIFDPQLMKGGNSEEMESMTGVATLAEACLNIDIDKRPSMKDVVQELLWISSKRRPDHAWLPANVKQVLNVVEEEETSVLIMSQEKSQGQGKHVRFDETSVPSDMNPSVQSISFDVENMNSLAGGR
eukprot:Gb_03183 [translate_table: standard]